MEALTGSQRTKLRGLAQKASPAIQVGKSGLTPEVLREFERALDRLELVKVRLPKLEAAQRRSFLNQLATSTGSELCGQVGHTASFFRRNPDPKKQVIALP